MEGGRGWRVGGDARRAEVGSEGGGSWEEGVREEGVGTAGCAGWRGARVGGAG